MEYVEGKATQKYGFSLQMSGNHLQMVIFQLPRNGERNWKLSQRVMTGVALGEVSDVLSDQGFRSRTGSIWRKRTLKHQNSNPNHQPSFFSYKYLYIYIYISLSLSLYIYPYFSFGSVVFSKPILGANPIARTAKPSPSQCQWFTGPR